MAEHRFQIHLGGIIDLLSNHLYSSPSVYVRELLQNATDAIRARGTEGRVTITVAGEPRPQLTIEDDGIGLTEDEVHRFLSTIGASSKRLLGEAKQLPRGHAEAVSAKHSDSVGGTRAIHSRGGEVSEETSREVEDLDRSDFIGQFGIGLLSCFVVSEEISVLTRSAKGGPAISWRGRADGTYVIEERDPESTPVGTTVHLIPKPDMVEWFAADEVRGLAAKFGALLPFPIIVSAEGRDETINEVPPWRRKFESPSEAREASLEFGKRLLDSPIEFFDVLPLKSEAGEVDGLAYVLPYSPSPTAPAAHRVYLKDMLLSEKADNLLPRWAFFVTCVLNTNSLRPTASRESFYEDEALSDARDALGVALREYLIDLQQNDPIRLEALIALHYRAIKALAAQDDDLFALFIDLLPFETSMGRMKFGEIRARYKQVRYSPSVDVFRQIAQVASAQRILVINAGYSYDPDLLARVPEAFPDLEVQAVDATDLTGALGDVGRDGEIFVDLITQATRVLADYDCDVDLKRFAPAELPVLYVTGEDATFQRAIEVSRRAQSEESVWGGMLDNLGAETKDARAVLVFNASNPLVGRLARVSDDEALRLSVQMLYVQALLLGHHALRPEEMSLLNVGLLDLIGWGLSQARGGGMLQ